MGQNLVTSCWPDVYFSADTLNDHPGSLGAKRAQQFESLSVVAFYNGLRINHHLHHHHHHRHLSPNMAKAYFIIADHFYIMSSFSKPWFLSLSNPPQLPTMSSRLSLFLLPRIFPILAISYLGAFLLLLVACIPTTWVPTFNHIYYTWITKQIIFLLLLNMDLHIRF